MNAKLLTALQKNPFVLAPMAGITDMPFRSFMKTLDCSIVITELVSAHGLEFNSERTFALMRYEERQRPIGIQIFGETPEILARAAKIVEQTGADFVDLNFGCPVPKVVKKGAGSAILRDLEQLTKVLRAVKSAVNIPVTIKVRTGWDSHSRNADRVAHIAYNEGITWMAIHGRTRAEAYSGQADWDYIAQVKSTAHLPILGNGDLVSAPLAVKRLKETGCDGVMIGRGCLKNPWIFREALALWNGDELNKPGEKNFFGVFAKLKYYLEQSCDERIVLIQLRKFAAWYSSGYPGSATFRKQIFQVDEKERLMSIANDFFASMTPAMQADTSHEPFLMGGHG